MGDGARAVSVPTRPKTEAEAPTERTSGRKTTDTIVPKIPESTYRLPMRHEPKLRSSGTWGGHRRRDRGPWDRRPEPPAALPLFGPHAARPEGTLSYRAGLPARSVAAWAAAILMGSLSATDGSRAHSEPAGCPEVAQCEHVHTEVQQAAVQPVAAEHAPPLALLEDQPVELAARAHHRRVRRAQQDVGFARRTVLVARATCLRAVVAGATPEGLKLPPILPDLDREASHAAGESERTEARGVPVVLLPVTLLPVILVRLPRPCGRQWPPLLQAAARRPAATARRSRRTNRSTPRGSRGAAVAAGRWAH